MVQQPANIAGEKGTWKTVAVSPWGCTVHSMVNSRKEMAEPGQTSRPGLHPVLEQLHWHTEAHIKRSQKQPEFRL
jgi:hypothetical protein